MSYEPKLIAPFDKSGLSKYYKPWIIGREAFPEIKNAYPWRGNVRKREGTRLLASFPDEAGLKPTVQGLKNWINPSVLAENLVGFSQKKSYFYDNVSGLFNDMTFYANPAGTAFSFGGGSDDYFWSSNHAGSMWVSNNVDTMFFWDGNPGAVGVSGGWSIFEPTVNGTTQLQKGLIVLPYKGRLVVLNTKEGGLFFPSRARWSQLGTPYTSNVVGVPIVSIVAGNPTVVNLAPTTSFIIGKPAGITLVQGTMGPTLNFNQFNVSAINPGVSITIDVDTTGLVATAGTGIAQGPGTTVPPAPFGIDIFAWRDDIPGRGGYIDADTSERIVSAEIIKDTLIVFFQRSTWRLRYTNNEVLPFIWERLNTQYGAEATHSHVGFDDMALAFSRYGWVGSTTNDVARIDEEIPDDSFAVESNNSTFSGMSHIQGIRDFYRQMAYWTYESIEGTEANQIYAYNYLTKVWSIFEPVIPIRTFGYYRTTNNISWAQLNNNVGNPDQYDSWENYNSQNDLWSGFGGGEVINFPYIVGGDATGNVYQMFEFFQHPTSDNGNAFGFTIKTKLMNPYIEKGMKARLGYCDLYCTLSPGAQITVNHYVDDLTSPVLTKIVDLYSNGPVPISNIVVGNPTTIFTNGDHNLQSGQRTTISDVNGTAGEILNNNSYIVTKLTNTSFTVPTNTTPFTYTAGGFVYSEELMDGRSKYTRIYLGAIAHFHQLEFTLTDDQIADPIDGLAQFEMQGLVLWWKECGRIRG